MPLETIAITPLEIEKLDLAISQNLTLLHTFLESLEEDQINQVPYKDSWTAGQLVRHITKSLNGIGMVMSKKGKPADRDPSQLIPDFKTSFLDFDTKMKSPDFIVPENRHYEKIELLTEQKQAWLYLKSQMYHTQLDKLIEGLPMGPATKWELLHFVCYHTQRHLRQMGKICEALK